MRQIGVALDSYAKANRGFYPPLSKSAGRLLFVADSLYPKYLTDATLFVCPDHPQQNALRQQASIDPRSVIDDESYWYLGYMIVHERSGLAWLSDYEHFVPMGQVIPDVDEVWPDCTENVRNRKEDWERKLDAYVKREGHTPYNVYNEFVLPQLDERHLYRALRTEVGRYIIYEIGNPAALMYVSAYIPIMIERPELHGNGGHVLFLDGHVKFCSYPGEFPMTVDFIRGLRLLDELERFPTTHAMHPQGQSAMFDAPGQRASR